MISFSCSCRHADAAERLSDARAGRVVPNTAAAEGFPKTSRVFRIEGIRLGRRLSMISDPEKITTKRVAYRRSAPDIKSALPVYATTVNKDGNEDVTGLPTVLGEAALGTYVGWNLATTGWYGPNASNGPGSVGQVLQARATAEAICPSGTPRLTARQPVIRVCHSRSGTAPMTAISASLWLLPMRLSNSASFSRRMQQR